MFRVSLKFLYKFQDLKVIYINVANDGFLPQILALVTRFSIYGVRALSIEI